MPRLDEIKASVTELSDEAISIFSDWFEAFLGERWDRQIKADVAAGKFDRHAEQVLAEFLAAKTKTLN